MVAVLKRDPHAPIFSYEYCLGYFRDNILKLLGMEKKIQDKLYTGFFSTKGSKGTGLGLPVTQKIVHEHKGELLFKTEVGKGTTFNLILPDV